MGKYVIESITGWKAFAKPEDILERSSIVKRRETTSGFYYSLCITHENGLKATYINRNTKEELEEILSRMKDVILKTLQSDTSTEAITVWKGDPDVLDPGRAKREKALYDYQLIQKKIHRLERNHKKLLIEYDAACTDMAKAENAENGSPYINVTKLEDIKRRIYENEKKYWECESKYETVIKGLHEVFGICDC